MMYNKSGSIMAWQATTQSYKREGTKRLKCIVYRVINFFLGTLLDALMCLLLNMGRSYPFCSVCTIPHQINVILQGKPTKNFLRKKSSFCHKLKFLIPICNYDLCPNLMNVSRVSDPPKQARNQDFSREGGAKKSAACKKFV